MKVLIAEDEVEVLGTMERKVKAEGYDVVTAKDGYEAWELIQKEHPDIILLDLMMPKMDGLEVLKNLRKNPSSDKWQPVIIVSALGELENIKKGFSMDADHYITKPCGMEDIVKGIKLMEHLIPQRKTQKEIKQNKLL